MKKFIVYLLVIVLTVSLSFAVFYLVRNDEVITISTSSMYVDKDDTFTIDVTLENKKPYTDVTISSSNENIVKYDANSKEFIALSGGVSRINFKTNNVKFRNLSCDVIVGDGTITSPFYISTAEQLASIGMGDRLQDENGNQLNAYAGKAPYEKYSSDKYYKLIDNIDVSTVNGGYWVPLRNFSGSLDGNGLTISKVSLDINNYKTLNDGKSGLFDTTNVGFFSEILPDGIVYNLKFENFGAVGKYTNFGCVAGINNGTIERVEVKDAFLSVESDVFGGIAAINKVPFEDGENDTYDRKISRIECSNVNFTLGKKYAANSSDLVTYGVTGKIGGIAGINDGGTIAYSYATGDIYFGADNNEKDIAYGGLVAVNNAKQMNKIGGIYTQLYQGGNIKDSYSSINTYLMKTPHSTSVFGGVIGVNNDTSLGEYDETPNMIRVANYLAGVKYNKDSLNLNNNIENYTKDFKGVGSNYIDGVASTFVESSLTINGLTISEMKNKDNFIAYTSQYDKDGKLLEEKQNVLWSFDSIWGIDAEVNGGIPYLNYTIVTIADDFRYVGIPVVDSDVYKFTFDKSQPIVIVSGNNGYLELKLNETYNLVVSPYEAMADITWTSSDSSKVSVDNDGKITALDGGIVTITAETNSGFVDSINVRVIVDDVYYVENLTSEINLYVGDTYQFDGYKIYVNGNVVDNKVLSYYATSDIISVTAGGKVTANAPGTTTIEVSVGNYTKTINVNVCSKSDNANKVVDITFKETNFHFTYSSSPINANLIISSAMCDSTDIKENLEYTFETDNDMVEIKYASKSITSDGIVIPFTVKGAGRTIISCVVSSEGYYSNASEIIVVSEMEQKQESLILNNTSIKLLEGKSQQLSASGFSNKTVVWSTLDATIATVDKYGLVTAVAEGATSINASITLNDGSKLYANCFVTVIGEDKYINHSATINGKNVGNNLVIYEMYQNEEITIKLDTNYKFGTNENFKWNVRESSKIDVLSTSGSNDNTIKIKGLLVGKTPVTVSAGSKVSITFYIKVLKAVEPDDGGEVVGPPAPVTPAYKQYITNINELNNVRYHLDKDFILLKSIDLSGADWEPIAWESGEYFTGSFVAMNGSVISNLRISGDYMGYHGLFGKLNGATIEDVAVDYARINTYKYAGAIAAYAMGKTSISGCSVTNSIFSSNTTNSYMGAILGDGGNSTNIPINDCISYKNGFSMASGCAASIGGIVGCSSSLISGCAVKELSITANYDSNSTYVGGIVGYNKGYITNSFVDLHCTIIGYYAGGLSGNLNATNKMKVQFSEHTKGYRKQDISESSYTNNIYKSFVSDTVSIKGVMVGGLVGSISNGAVVDCYTSAKLEGLTTKAIVGGFTAELMSDANFGRKGGYGCVGIIDTCYSTCTFSGNGKFYSSTSNDNVHKYNFFGGDDVLRNAGYMFNYLVEKRSGVNNLSCSGLTDYIKAVKSASDMKNKQTYLDKGFSSTIWKFGAGYPTI